EVTNPLDAFSHTTVNQHLFSNAPIGPSIQHYQLGVVSIPNRPYERPYEFIIALCGVTSHPKIAVVPIQIGTMKKQSAACPTLTRLHLTRRFRHQKRESTHKYDISQLKPKYVFQGMWIGQAPVQPRVSQILPV